MILKPYRYVLLFSKKEKIAEPSQDFASLIIRRADDFRSFYEERFAGKLNLQFNSLYLLDTIVDEARKSTASPDRKQWLAVHCGRLYLSHRFLAHSQLPISLVSSARPADDDCRTS